MGRVRLPDPWEISGVPETKDRIKEQGDLQLTRNEGVGDLCNRGPRVLETNLVSVQGSRLGSRPRLVHESLTQNQTYPEHPNFQVESRH